LFVRFLTGSINDAFSAQANVGVTKTFS